MPTLSMDPTAADRNDALARPFSVSGGRLLVATDSSPAATAAIHVAHAIARQHGAEVQVINVSTILPVPFPPPLGAGFALFEVPGQFDTMSERSGALLARISEVLAEPVAWKTHFALGDPARAILCAAIEIGATLVVLGLRRHGRVDRMLHDETTLSVMRGSACPVLGVATGTTSVPKRVVSAMDFSPVSIAAATCARAIMRPDGTMVLAYVPSAMRDDPRQGEATIRALGVVAAFTRCALELRGDGTEIDHAVVTRDPDQSIAEAVLDYADASQADMISVGATGQDRLERWLLGSVSTDLVRDGSHTILLVPNAQRNPTLPLVNS